MGQLLKPVQKDLEQADSSSMRRRLSTCKRHNVNAVRRLSRSSAGRKAQANLLCFGRGRGGSGVRDSGVVSLQVGLDSFGCSALGSCRRLRDGGRVIT